MTAIGGVKQASKNLYAELMKDEKTLAERKKRNDAIKAKMDNMLATMAGRKCNWTPDRIAAMDKLALMLEKRCIMWDDEGVGFYLMMRWDWKANRPTVAARLEDRMGPGWYANFKEMFQAPLLDTSVPDEELGAWIDKHTMLVHGFLDKQDKLKRDENGKLYLDDPYMAVIHQAPDPIPKPPTWTEPPSEYPDWCGQPTEEEIKNRGKKKKSPQPAV